MQDERALRHLVPELRTSGVDERSTNTVITNDSCDSILVIPDLYTFSFYSTQIRRSDSLFFPSTASERGRTGPDETRISAIPQPERAVTTYLNVFTFLIFYHDLDNNAPLPRLNRFLADRFDQRAHPHRETFLALHKPSVKRTKTNKSGDKPWREASSWTTTSIHQRKPSLHPTCVHS